MGKLFVFTYGASAGYAGECSAECNCLTLEEIYAKWAAAYRQKLEELRAVPVWLKEEAKLVEAIAKLESAHKPKIPWAWAENARPGDWCRIQLDTVCHSTVYCHCVSQGVPDDELASGVMLGYDW